MLKLRQMLDPSNLVIAKDFVIEKVAAPGLSAVTGFTWTQTMAVDKENWGQILMVVCASAAVGTLGQMVTAYFKSRSGIIVAQSEARTNERHLNAAEDKDLLHRVHENYRQQIEDLNKQNTRLQTKHDQRDRIDAIKDQTRHKIGEVVGHADIHITVLETLLRAAAIEPPDRPYLPKLIAELALAQDKAVNNILSGRPAGEATEAEEDQVFAGRNLVNATTAAQAADDRVAAENK